MWRDIHKMLSCSNCFVMTELTQFSCEESSLHCHVQQQAFITGRNTVIIQSSRHQFHWKWWHYSSATLRVACLDNVVVRDSPILKRAVITDKFFTGEAAVHFCSRYSAAVVNTDIKQLIWGTWNGSIQSYWEWTGGEHTILRNCREEGTMEDH